MKTRILFFYFILLVLLSGTAIADDEQGFDAHYLANAGVMIARGNTKILFDPFFRNDYGQYDLVPPEIEAALIAGLAPWDSVDAVFISHHHDDHFDPAVVLSYLQKWPGVSLYAPQQAVDELLTLIDTTDESVLKRVHGLELAHDSGSVSIDAGGLLIEAVRIAHGGWPSRNADVENIVFRVTLDESTTVMHLGDADAAKELYEPHASYWDARTTDLALVPVWLMLTEKGRYTLDEHIGAGHEIGIHVYKHVPELPEQRPEAFEGLDVFTNPGEVRHFK